MTAMHEVTLYAYNTDYLSPDVNGICVLHVLDIFFSPGHECINFDIP